jgi:hypothetical protein
MKPTIGRIVHVHSRSGSYSGAKPEPAIVCSEDTGTGLVVAGFDANGDPFKLERLLFHEDPKKPRPASTHASWPPL